MAKCERKSRHGVHPPCEPSRPAEQQHRELPAPEADPTMQILHPFAGSVQQYLEQLPDPDRYRPACCPQCQAKQPLTAHGFYTRTLVDVAFDGLIRVRRYLCQFCRRTVSLLPEFALPYLRFSIAVISLWLLARLLPASPGRTAPPPMPYQRGQFWLRRFRSCAPALCATLAALVAPAPRRLPSPRPRHARIHRLDPRPSLPVRRSPPTSAGLAAVRSLPPAAVSLSSAGAAPA